MLLSVGLPPLRQALRHIAQSGPVTEERFNRRPEPASHQRIDLREPLALELRRNAPPPVLRLRQAPSDLRLARIKPLSLESLLSFVFNHWRSPCQWSISCGDHSPRNSRSRSPMTQLHRIPRIAV